MKYKSLIPSLALIDHLADRGTGPVTMESLKRAIEWGTYLETHARRIYNQHTEPTLTATRALARKILNGELQDTFTLRDCYHPHWSRLTNKGEVYSAVEYLIDSGWLQPECLGTGGKPKTIHHINPRIYEDDFVPFAPK